jgi:hypothetical protein
MKYIASTYEIIAWKYLNRSVDEKWSQWAVDMMSEGYETEYLIELAGILKPYDQLELKHLMDKVFQELNLDYSVKEKVINDYITYLGNQVLNGERDLLKSLRILEKIYIELDFDESIYDFNALCCAKEDLEYSEVQWYWEGANRSNIDQICLDYFRNWINKIRL